LILLPKRKKNEVRANCYSLNGVVENKIAIKFILKAERGAMAVGTFLVDKFLTF
jgi:hypothetical protein